MLFLAVLLQVKHHECQSEGKDNILTVREAGQRARVLQLFLGCWVCESTLNAKLMTHCQNLNLCWIKCVCVCLSVVFVCFGTEAWLCIQWWECRIKCIYMHIIKSESSMSEAFALGIFDHLQMSPTLCVCTWLCFCFLCLDISLQSSSYRYKLYNYWMRKLKCRALTRSGELPLSNQLQNFHFFGSVWKSTAGGLCGKKQSDK